VDSNRLKDRVALVTGGSRGIGRATVLKLAQAGAAVIVNYRKRADEANQVVDQVQASGGRALAIQADVGDPAEVQKMVEQSVRELGPVDILVNNAGVFRGGTLLSYDEADADLLWQVNVKGVIHCSAAVVPLMIERQFGRIVNLSSVAAVGTSFPGTTFYSATKAAVTCLTRRFALELGSHGICVNAVSPGYVGTDMNLEGRSQEEIQKAADLISARSMLGRFGKSEEIAAVISFLVSDEAGFVTGQVITADGGRIDFLTHD
jgi:3-oxoacyl-[acyl-carrier protein] reductase